MQTHLIATSLTILLFVLILFYHEYPFLSHIKLGKKPIDSQNPQTDKGEPHGR